MDGGPDRCGLKKYAPSCLLYALGGLFRVYKPYSNMFVCTALQTLQQGVHALVGLPHRRDGRGTIAAERGGWLVESQRDSHRDFLKVDGLGGTLGLETVHGEMKVDVVDALCGVVHPDDRHRVRCIIVDPPAAARAFPQK